MKPTLSDVHINKPLTNISVAYIQSLDDFVADKVFPQIFVNKDSDHYFTYPKGYWFRTAARKRGLSQESAGIDYGISYATYNCDVYAVHKDIDDKLRANEDTPLSLDRDSTQLVTHDLMLEKELSWGAKYFTTGVWSADVTPSTLWDATGSTPLADIRAQRTAIHSKTGKWANVLTVSTDVWNVLLDHPSILGRLSDAKDRNITKEFVARLLELDRIVVAGAVKNDAKEGATDDLKHVFSKDALLTYSEPNPGILKASAGYTFVWKGYLGNAPQGMKIKRFRIERIASDRVEGETAYDQKLVGSDLGVFFNNAIS